MNKLPAGGANFSAGAGGGGEGFGAGADGFVSAGGDTLRIQDAKIITKKTTNLVKTYEKVKNRKPEQKKDNKNNTNKLTKRTTTWLNLDEPAKMTKVQTEYLQGVQLWLQEQEELKALVLVQRVSSPLEETLWEYKMPRSRPRQQHGLLRLINNTR